jgi:hypothetical protein
LQSLQSAPQLGSWFVDPYRSPRTVRNGRTAKILLRETENSKNTAEAWPALFTLPRVPVRDACQDRGPVAAPRFFEI